MDLQNGIPRPEATQQEVIDAYNKCCLCGSDLEFSYTTDFMNLKVTEQATCKCCGIQNKTHDFKLQ